MKTNIAIIATAWGTKKGGVNSFNYDYCRALGKTSSSIFNIVCIVPTANEEQIEDALTSGISLCLLSKGKEIDISEKSADEILRVFKEKYGGLPKWWIGHDVITGLTALACNSIGKDSKVAIFHHMDYSSYKGMEGENTESKVRLQSKLLQNADVVLSVGPKLMLSAERKILGKPNIKHLEIIPGLPEIEGLPALKQLNAISFGRISPRTDLLKQTRLAVASFGEAHSVENGGLDKDDYLTIIGLEVELRDKQHKELLQLARKHAGRVVQIHGWQFSENRNELLEVLRSSSVCLMLSLHEGFGLVGWEAIAAEVPLIISTNSGVYQAIESFLGGMGTGCLYGVEIRGEIGEHSYQEADVEDVKNALLKIKKNPVRAKEDARSLKKLLSTVCNWDNVVHATIEAMSLDKELAKHNTDTLTTIGVEHWQPQLLLDALIHSTDIVDEAARRKRMYQHLWNAISYPARVTDRIVIYGGVATSLCNAEAASLYAEWLIECPNAELFICYEVGEAALERANQLSKAGLKTLREKNGLPTNPKERMDIKAQRIKNLENLIVDCINDENGKSEVIQRIYMLPLMKPLTTYITCLDNDIYITPLFETRSSETLTFMLSQETNDFKDDVIRYIEHHLKRNLRVEDMAHYESHTNKLLNSLSMIKNPI